MKGLRFGTEIEFTGLTRAKAAEAIAEYFGVQAHGTKVTKCGRIWKIVHDASIRAENGGERCELVTPILTWADIEPLQEIVRKLRRAGAIVNNSCGQHVHVGAENLTAKAIRNLVNNFAGHEELLIEALNVHENRRNYCKALNERFLRELNAKKPATLAELRLIWYGDDGNHAHHYDFSRYQTLNLHALFTKGTVEFRLFNATLHAGEVKTAIQLCLALVADAIRARSTRLKKIAAENKKFAMRTWLTRPQGLNLNGDEFKTLRHHLLKNLDGNAAWRFAI